MGVAVLIGVKILVNELVIILVFISVAVGVFAGVVGIYVKISDGEGEGLGVGIGEPPLDRFLPGLGLNISDSLGVGVLVITKVGIVDFGGLKEEMALVVLLGTNDGTRVKSP